MQQRQDADGEVIPLLYFPDRYTNKKNSSYRCIMDNSYIPENYSNRAVCWKYDHRDRKSVV
jgi:hypothetical protein